MDKIILLISRSNGLNYRDILKDVKWYYSMYGIISIKDRTSYADSDEIANAIKIAYPDLGINVSKYMDNNNNINEICIRTLVYRLDHNDETYTGAGKIPIFCLPMDNDKMISFYRKSLKKEKFEFVDFNLVL